MKKMLRRILSFVMLVCIAFMGVFTMPMVSAKAAASYIETDFGEGKLLITTTYNGSTYYLPATTTTSSGPIATKFTDVSEIGEEHLWTVTAAGENYFIKNSAGKCLYTNNSTGNSVRVGDTEHAWTYNSTENSFKNATTGYYLGVYNGATWRCYASVTANNFKNTDGSYNSKSFKFYKVNEAASGISISGDTYMQVNKKITLTATTSNVTGDVAWKSSNTDVATVENGVVTGHSVGTATITAFVGSVEGTYEVTVYPVENSLLSIADAIKVCEFTGTTNSPNYSTMGVIESIDYGYNETDNNISVTITDGTNSIQAYKMTGGADLEVYDKITITGALCMYGTTHEFNEGCTYTVIDDNDWEAIKEQLNFVDAYMKLGYKYTQETEKTSLVTDILNKELTGVGSSYGEWSEKEASSAAVYAGQSAGGNDSIQLRTTNSNSGIVTTVSGGTAKKIVIEWNSNTTAKRTLNIYGSNTAYTAATDLYAENLEPIGTLTYNGADQENDTELTIPDEYKYIGFRSADGALYLTSVEITWDTGVEKEVTTLKDSKFRILCGVNASLLDIENFEVGIQVVAGDKTVNYTTTADSWTVEGDKAYIIIKLGDIVNDKAKLETTFTVKAYVVYEDIVRTSKNTAEYSVKSMVEEYYGMEQHKAQVEDLYNYLFN